MRDEVKSKLRALQDEHVKENIDEVNPFLDR